MVAEVCVAFSGVDDSLSPERVAGMQTFANGL